MGGRSWDPRGFVESDVVEDLVEGSCGKVSRFRYGGMLLGLGGFV